MHICTYIYIYIYIYMYICIYIDIHIHTHVYIYTYTYTYIHIKQYINISLYLSLSLYIYIYIQTAKVLSALVPSTTASADMLNNQGFQGYGVSIIRIRYLVPRMLFVLCLVVQRFFESRDV